ncbi:hypothetical protein [Alicyclobacillus fastidiosus]|uniref:Uncharacterized protein n=1 Tax=Alicyclobacillus fastidiosus TaxID=392011 RepID=A0ABV5AHM4_9BACL|nr:hypothetical protein [Alicyclobacillus fastidiosus]WEH11520.1 hypothetical protein PYS47_10065 [Alicyclobacillus fastidiosus]
MNLHLATSLDQYLATALQMQDVSQEYVVLGNPLSRTMNHIVKSFNIKVIEHESVTPSLFDSKVIFNERTKTIANRTDYTVFGIEGDPWLPLARVWAYFKKAKLITLQNISDVFPTLRKIKSKYCAVVSHPDRITARTIAELQAYNMETWISESHSRVGFLTSRTPEGLTELFFKTLFYQHENSDTSAGITLTRKQGRILNSDLHPTVYTNVTTTEELKDYLSTYREYFNLYTEAWEDHFFTGDGFICTIGGLTDPLNRTGAYKLPSCAQSGECYDLSRNILPTYGIKSKVIFANACTNLRFTNGLFESNYGLMQGFIEGFACAYIGSNITKWAMDDENLLFQILFESGATLGEIVDALNRNCYIRRIEHMNYVVVGDPEYRLRQPIKKRCDSNISCIRDPLSNSVIIDINNTNSNFIQFQFEESDLWSSIKDANVNVGVLRGTRNVSEVFYELYPQSDGKTVRCALFSWDFINSDLLQIRIGSNHIPEQLKTVIIPSYENLTSLHNFQINIQKINSSTREINDKIKNLIKLELKHRFNAICYQKLTERLNGIIKLLSNCEHEVLSYLLYNTESPSYNFPDSYYASHRIDHVENSLDCCPHCNDSYYIYHFENITRPGLQRLKSLCPVCGEISDQPNNELHMLIDSDDKLLRGEKKTISVVVENASDNTKSVICGMRFVDGHRFDIKCLTPEITEIILPPNSSRTLAFQFITTNKTPLHLVYGRAYAISNADIYLCSKPFWINR